MSVRQQILTSPETLSDFVWAAEQRFREGEELLATARFAGSIYLLGLAAEMWLKLACFRFRGAGPATPIDSQLGPAKSWMRLHAPSIAPESNHSLLYWSEYLVRIRIDGAIPLSGAVTGQLRHHIINRLFQDWKIEMRYHSLGLTQLDAWRVYCDALWLRQNWQSLWR